MGISLLPLLEGKFAQKLCSPKCYNSCPNIVALYFGLDAGEGVFLPKFCEEQAVTARRGAMEIRSSGLAPAAGPMSGYADKLACAPSQFVEDVADGPPMPPMEDVDC